MAVETRAALLGMVASSDFKENLQAFDWLPDDVIGGVKTPTCCRRAGVANNFAIEHDPNSSSPLLLLLLLLFPTSEDAGSSKITRN